MKSFRYNILGALPQFSLIFILTIVAKIINILHQWSKPPLHLIHPTLPYLLLFPLHASLYLCIRIHTNMNNSHGLTLKKADSTQDFENGKQLFLQYIQSLDFELNFQDVNRELAEIAIEYNHPTGVLLLVNDGNKAIACAGVRKIDANVAELKRMFVDPQYRGRKLGQQLLQQALTAAKQLGYRFIRLDTVPAMHAAIKLYQSVGFYEIEPYRFNPIPGAIFMEKEL